MTDGCQQGAFKNAFYRRKVVTPQLLTTTKTAVRGTFQEAKKWTSEARIDLRFEQEPFPGPKKESPVLSLHQNQVRIYSIDEK